MADRGLARLLRTRRPAFLKAHGLLVKGFDHRSCILRSVREMLAIARDWRFHSAMESEFPRRAAIRELIQNVEADNQRLMDSLRRLSESLELSSFFCYLRQ